VNIQPCPDSEHSALSW